MNYLDSIPTECSTMIFSYLELADCFRVGSVSLAMMKEVMISLNSRRSQLKKRYSCISRRRLVTTNSYIETREVVESNHAEDEVHNSPFSSSQQTFIPTIEDRIEFLSATIPASYPLHKALRCELRHNVLHDDIQTTEPCFMKVFPIFQRIAHPLKLYIWLLSNVLRSDHSTRKAVTDRISLDEYIGDVLCVTFLVHPGCVNLKELSSNLARLFDSIQSNPCGIPSYMSWVFLHSTILRMKKFSSSERKRLGIPDLQGLDTDGSMCLPMDCYRTDSFMSSEMILVSDTFGPLGSSFRLRDIVRTHSLSAHCLFAYLNAIEVSDPTDNNGRIHRGSAGDLATEWLFSVHEEVHKVRPMTVRQPVVRLVP
jgi:hypothetical protein